MRRIKYSFLAIALLFTAITSCKDDSIVIVPEWESGVHGFASFKAGSAKDFLKGDPSQALDMEISWNSIDQKNKVTKIDMFLLYNEAYLDQDDNPKTAKHGGDEGKLYMTFDGATVPADKVPTDFSVSQQDVYDLYDGAEYDYYGTGALPVWGAGSIRVDRNTTNFKFVDGDTFQVRWELTTEDGRVFSAWGVSVCTEFPGANCAVNWGTICSQVIAEPAGDWVIDMQDFYGDGWQGGYLGVIIDGVEAFQVKLPNQAGTAAGQETVTVPPGTTTLTFEWNKDTYQSECGFKITSPKGNVVAKGGPSPKEGLVVLNLCVENE